jgi:hypothetical protein
LNVFVKMVLNVAMSGFGTSFAKFTQATFSPLAKLQMACAPLEVDAPELVDPELVEPDVPLPDEDVLPLCPGLVAVDVAVVNPELAVDVPCELEVVDGPTEPDPLVAEVPSVDPLFSNPVLVSPLPQPAASAASIHRLGSNRSRPGGAARRSRIRVLTGVSTADARRLQTAHGTGNPGIQARQRRKIIVLRDPAPFTRAPRPAA